MNKDLTNEIVSFMHCKDCMMSIPAGLSPRDWAQIEAGWTPKGFQVWCKRHEVNVISMDFLGQKLAYADMDVKDGFQVEKEAK